MKLGSQEVRKQRKLYIFVIKNIALIGQLINTP